MSSIIHQINRSSRHSILERVTNFNSPALLVLVQIVRIPTTMWWHPHHNVPLTSTVGRKLMLRLVEESPAAVSNLLCTLTTILVGQDATEGMHCSMAHKHACQVESASKPVTCLMPMHLQASPDKCCLHQ